MNIYDLFEELAFILSEYNEPNLKKEIEITMPINYFYGINKALKKAILFTSIAEQNLLEPNIISINSRNGVTFKLKIKEFK